VISRDKEIAVLRDLVGRHRVVGLVGARQVGKTTLAGMLARTWPEPVHFFDAENPEDFARLSDAMLA
jgi:predicted AAA+ superfamily ATPase